MVYIAHLVLMTAAESYLSDLSRFNSGTTNHQRHSNVELVQLSFIIGK